MRSFEPCHFTAAQPSSPDLQLSRLPWSVGRSKAGATQRLCFVVCKRCTPHRNWMGKTGSNFFCQPKNMGWGKTIEMKRFSKASPTSHSTLLFKKQEAGGSSLSPTLVWGPFVSIETSTHLGYYGQSSHTPGRPIRPVGSMQEKLLLSVTLVLFSSHKNSTHLSKSHLPSRCNKV